MTSCTKCHGGFLAAYFHGKLWNKRVLKRQAVRCRCPAGRRLSEKIMGEEEAERHTKFSRWIPKAEVHESREVVVLEGEDERRR